MREMLTAIEKIEAAPGQRILVVSDVHGHFNHLVQLLRKMEYGGDDILVIVGDLIEKGPESLRVVQYVMDLSRQHPVYVSMGNVELGRLQMLWRDDPESGESFAGFLKWSEEYWESCLFGEMLADMGIKISQVDGQNAPEYRRRIREQFHEELDFLWSRPTILTAGRYLFVHGGVPTDDLDALAGTEAHSYLKNDSFLDKGYGFERYTVVTGHWPVSLYRSDREDMGPLFERERNILCIDGGCGLKQTGQLNGVIIPDCMAGMEEIRWESYDDFPEVTALDDREEAPCSFHVQYFDNRVELLEEKGKNGIIRHLSSGKVFEAPLKWLYPGETGLQCTDLCDGRLAVSAGDRVKLVFETEDGLYVKKQGQLGWYDGRVKPEDVKPYLTAGTPCGENWRREREVAVYGLLERLGISFDRIDHWEANTMEACRAIDEVLDAAICKNLFLCNQQRTRFYLLLMPEGKKFRTKDLSRQIDSSRLSFGEAVYLERFLRLTPGSVSVMGLMNDIKNQVQLLIDREVLEEGGLFGCHPCINTSSIRLSLSDLLEKFLPAVHHEPIFVDMPL